MTTIKLKECEKRDKYLDLARELKKLWNMKVTVIPIVIGAFGTVTKVGREPSVEMQSVYFTAPADWADDNEFDL